MLLKTLLIIFFLTQVSALTCPSNCSSCYSKSGYTYCNSCNTDYFLYSFRCKKCSECSLYDSCNSCTTSEDESTSFLTIIIILCIILGSVICLAVVLRFFYVKCKQDQAINVIQANGAPIPPTSMSLAPSAYNNSDNNWIKSEKPCKWDENCAICLENMVFLQTNCHHYFHPQCISQWLIKKKGDCPLCKTQIVSPSKIYCNSCYKQYCEIDVNNISQRPEEGKFKQCFTCKTSFS